MIIAGYGGHAGYAFAIAYHVAKTGIIDKSKIDIIVPKGIKWIREKLKKYGRIIEAPLPRKPNEPLNKTLKRWIPALIRALENCTDQRIILGTGSNFSIPHTLACKIKRKRKIFVLEAVDRIISYSKTPKLLSLLGAIPIISWEEQKRNYPNGMVVGPIYEPRIYQPEDHGYILVTTGTLGLPRLYKALAMAKIDNLIIQSGDIPPEKIKKLNPNWKVFQYTSDLHRWIANASLVITHYPGMTAVTARLAYHKPVVMVQSYRHKLSAKPEEGPLLAQKIKAPYIREITMKKITEGINRALKTTPPRLRNGAKIATMLILNEYKQLSANPF